MRGIHLDTQKREKYTRKSTLPPRVLSIVHNGSMIIIELKMAVGRVKKLSWTQNRRPRRLDMDIMRAIFKICKIHFCYHLGRLFAPNQLSILNLTKTKRNGLHALTQ